MRISFFIHFVVIVIRIGTWLKQRQQEKEQKPNEDEDIEEQLPKESNNPLDKSSQCSSSHSSDRSSTATNAFDIPLTNLLNKVQRNRSYSATLRGQRLLPDKPSIMKEIVNNPSNSWDYDDFSNQPDPTGPLTKSALIYRLMRSRLEANLAKSITSNKDKSKHKKKFNSSTKS